MREKTLIGVLASHDSLPTNEALANIFRDAWSDNYIRDLLTNFRFVFTGGTYKRLFNGDPIYGVKTTKKTTARYQLSGKISKYLHEQCGVIRLPGTNSGGVIMLSNLITQHKVSIIWSFLSPITTHLLFPQNIALLRLGDQWRVKKIMNTGSVNEWLRSEAERDARLNIQPVPLEIMFKGSGLTAKYHEAKLNKNEHSVTYTKVPSPLNFLGAKYKNKLNKELEMAVIALISHDAMKDRMLDFVIDFEHELFRFKSIVATGTTGKLIQEASPILAEKVHRYHSGPKGGDIEIATEILCGGCHVVIFFVDTLHPHPHTEDIRVIFGACMINDEVRMLSNEIQARDWMDRMIRGT